jgi:hypothetical protein
MYGSSDTKSGRGISGGMRCGTGAETMFTPSMRTVISGSPLVLAWR